LVARQGDVKVALHWVGSRFVLAIASNGAASQWTRSSRALLELFAALPAPRKTRGKRHNWGMLLMLIGAALVSGAQGMRAISQ
jgi:hypothetical protein